MSIEHIYLYIYVTYTRIFICMYILQSFLNNNIEISEIRKDYISCNFAKIITMRCIIYTANILIINIFNLYSTF